MKIIFAIFLLNLASYGWDANEHFIYAKLCFDKGLYKEAAFHLNIVKDKTTNQLLVAAANNNLAIIKEMNNKIQEAEELYTSAYRLAPKNKWIYSNLSNFKREHNISTSSEEFSDLNESGMKINCITININKQPEIQLPSSEEINVGVISEENEEKRRLWGEVFYNLIDELDFVPILSNNYTLFYGTSLINYDKSIILLTLYLHEEGLKEKSYKKQKYIEEEKRFVLIPYFETERIVRIKGKISLWVGKQEIFSKQFEETEKEKYPNKKIAEVPPYNFSLWRKLLISHIKELKDLSSSKLLSYKRYYIKWIN